MLSQSQGISIVVWNAPRLVAMAVPIDEVRAVDKQKVGKILDIEEIVGLVSIVKLKLSWSLPRRAEG